jgi:hypothetical protein
MKRIFLLLLLLFCSSGCSVISAPHPAPSSASLLPTNSPYYPFLSPKTFGRSYVALHVLEGHARGEKFALQVQVEITPDTILLLGFTPWQTRAFLLRYEGNALHFENFTDRELPFAPEFILSDLQQVLWPHLPDHNEWQVTHDSLTQERRVFFQQRLITSIRYHGDSLTNGDIELTNIPWDYQLRIHIDERTQ